MLRLLFWNLNHQPLDQTVSHLAQEYKVDLLVLAECDIPAGMIRSLNAEGSKFHLLDTKCSHVVLYSCFPRRFFTLLHSQDRYCIVRLQVPSSRDVLLCMAHLSDKFHGSDRAALEAGEMASILRRIEEDLGHRRSILVGDLNMNPFEQGVAGATGLHAVMTQSLAMQKERKVSGRFYPLFYNPMWSHFGDRSPGPPGTYYYRGSGATEYFWHMFDQVLIRPDLLPHFGPEGLKILTETEQGSLVGSNGRPEASDHLPFLLRLEL